MNIPEHIFKAYDIRGIYPDELNEDLIYKIGRAYGVLRRQELGQDKEINIVVAHDMRLSSPSLFKELTKGLVDHGINVIDIGLVSTPTFYFAVSYYKYDGGLLVSASHNPKEYNGIKIVREGATPVGQGMGMKELMELTQQGEFSEVNKPGKVAFKKGILRAQVDLAETYADLDKIKHFKIVLDTANSMGILYLEELFKDLPQIDLIKINDKLDGTFPAHQADPFQEKNLVQLKNKVLAEKADLGIATDGDGDRIFFIDNLSELVEPAIVRGITAQLFLRDNPGATICYDIRPGKITKDMILEAGGKPSVTRVGHSLIKKQMSEVGAIFGGESSGHFFVKFPHGIYEAPMIVTLKILQELSEKKISLADYTKPLKRYFHSGEINFKVEDKEAVLAKLKTKYIDAEINDLDGLTFTYPDYWFNVRSSNTESLLRLNLEAKTREVLEEKIESISKIIVN